MESGHDRSEDVKIVRRSVAQSGFKGEEWVLKDIKSGTNTFVVLMLLHLKSGYVLLSATKMEGNADNIQRTKRFFDSLVVIH